jgi:hypothetical protein
MDAFVLPANLLYNPGIIITLFPPNIHLPS